MWRLKRLRLLSWGRIFHHKVARSSRLHSLNSWTVRNRHQNFEFLINFFTFSDKLIVTGSEDGTVKFWDQREKNVAFTLEPYKSANIARPNFGRWIGSASINNDWVATGGGPRLALYHLRNRQPFQIFDFEKEIHVTDFIEDNLLAGKNLFEECCCKVFNIFITFSGGESNTLCQYSFKGDVLSEIETSGPSVLSVSWQTSPNCKILTACGASNKIDVSINFTYKDTTLNFYKKS